LIPSIQDFVVSQTSEALSQCS